MTDTEALNRVKITGNMTIPELVMAMSERNPGGLKVSIEIAKLDPLALLAFDDMNIRGAQLWVAFKDFAGCDIDILLNAAKERNKKMISIVNSEFPDGPIAIPSRWALED